MVAVTVVVVVVAVVICYFLEKLLYLPTVHIHAMVLAGFFEDGLIAIAGLMLVNVCNLPAICNHLPANT